MKVIIKSNRQKGDLAYEYHPFRNLLLSEDVLVSENGFYIPKGGAINPKNGEKLKKGEAINPKNGEVENYWIDKYNNIIKDAIEYDSILGPDFKAGTLVELNTDALNFDLNHPVDIEVLPSYDGSVNLILNDDKNPPRLINSRFSVRENNTYEIVDRIGENDTNVYSSNNFNKDASLYFLYSSTPKISFEGFSNGSLKVGLYCFYISYCDADGNESDYIAESGVIPAYLGNTKISMDGGIKNLNSLKGIKLKVSGLEEVYNYIKITYVRFFSDYNQSRVTEAKKIILKYPISRSYVELEITGTENTEDIDPNIINISKFNTLGVKALALCKNRLFFGNFTKNSDNYKDLQDLALRIVPEVDVIQDSDLDYSKEENIVNKVGYFGYGEYYRFGVVFIYNDGTLSNVYNTLGYRIEDEKTINLSLSKGLFYKTNTIYKEEGNTLTRRYIEIEDNGMIQNYGDFFWYSNKKDRYINSKGVCKLDLTIYGSQSYFIKFKITEDVRKELYKLGIRGLFFVRQKRIPTTITQMMVLPLDKHSGVPAYKNLNYDNVIESFIDLSCDGGRHLNHYKPMREIILGGTYLKGEHSYTLDSESEKAYAGICPDFLLNQPYYNQIFNGNEFLLELILRLKSKEEKGISGTNRLLNYSHTKNSDTDHFNAKVKICSVTEDVQTVSLEDLIYRLKIGTAEDLKSFRYIGEDPGVVDTNNIRLNYFRGICSPYLAIYSPNSKLDIGGIYNVKLNSNNSVQLEFFIRMNSSEPYYSIGDRCNLELESYSCYRGDCYINSFTYRTIRNFNDPTLPNNDVILDINGNKYSSFVDDSTTYNINSIRYAQLPEMLTNIGYPDYDSKDVMRSNVNAVQLGTWITFNIFSSLNYLLRSEDHSYVSEEALMGTPRTFYPKILKPWLGTYKKPDSYLYNDAYRNTLGYKCYFGLLDINYLKNTFSNRIQYSEISIVDSFKNNYRESLSTYFRDYSTEYGGITKLLDVSGYLLIVFEHGIGLAVINERVVSSNGGDGEPVFINTKNVLPEELTIISNKIGSSWSDSIIKTEQGNVYGVDTVAKKIWRIVGNQLEIISDFKVGKFLINNITLDKFEKYPTIGLRNVKTHYNNHKKDVMFTFYDDVYKDEEKVWNLCYSEINNIFSTFYSWIPSYSENIKTSYFSFDRETSKKIALLGKNNFYNIEDTGIVMTSHYIEEEIKFYYRKPNEKTYTLINSDKTTTTEKIPTSLYYSKGFKFKLEKDHWGNWKHFTTNSNGELINGELIKNSDYILTKPIYLEVTPFLETISNRLIEKIYYKTESIIITSILTLKNTPDSGYEDFELKNYFYIHGNSNNLTNLENLRPCYWYGEQHPFEFEFVVNDKIALEKIFTNLVLISNKAEPESFHFEIEGDGYEFSADKRNMYIRLESTKKVYLELGSDILYNREFEKAISSDYTKELYYRKLSSEYTDSYMKLDRVYPIYSEGLTQQVKSTIFPLYYEKIDTYNDIYHKYHLMKSSNSSDGMYDFLNLSGSEISWDKDANLFNIVTHIKNNLINLVGRLRGNSYYKDGKWLILIPSIIFSLKNELKWENNLPPLVINSLYVPKDINNTIITKETLPNIYTGKLNNPDDNIDLGKYIDFSDWTYRKEAKIKDKWIKIRVRYSGKNLAIIHSVVTLFNIMYN